MPAGPASPPPRSVRDQSKTPDRLVARRRVTAGIPVIRTGEPPVSLGSVVCIAGPPKRKDVAQPTVPLRITHAGDDDSDGDMLHTHLMPNGETRIACLPIKNNSFTLNRIEFLRTTTAAGRASWEPVHQNRTRN